MRRFIKHISIFFLFTFIYQLIFPSVVFALTGGPSQPEVQSFEPVGTSDMVDISSGDFNYNIPLLDVGGYPINLSYHSGITMDQEASWVGLGWNINPGVINRGMRSIPDDFQGETINKEFNIKPNETIGISGGVGAEVLSFDFGSLSLNAGLGINYNNYKGVGFDFSIRPSFSIADQNSNSLTAGLGLSGSSHDGATLSPSLSYSKNIDKVDYPERNLSASIGGSINSRAGMRALNLGFSVSDATKGDKKNPSVRMSSSMNGNATLSFASPTYVPQVQMPMKNLAISFASSAGTELTPPVFPNINQRMYYSKQELLRKEEALPAYGYLFSHLSMQWAKSNSILDFNREKDVPFTKNTPSLPLTNFTYDVFSVSGQGIGATYRPFRSDIGELYDPYNYNENFSAGGSIELGLGALLKIGGDIDYIDSRSESGKWSEGNFAQLSFKVKSPDPKGSKLYEPCYFKNVGEKTADPDNFLERTGGNKAVRVALLERGMEVETKEAFVKTTDDNDIQSYRPLFAHRKKRQRRNQNISILNAREASIVGLEKQIKSYEENSSPTNPSTIITAIDRYKNNLPERPDRKLHHLSELTATREDGARYVYGIAAYNSKQTEATFNVANNAGHDCANGVIDYSEEDRSIRNKKGIDHYFSSTDLPAYAHSYFLTAILSADYVDVTGDGPTEDDLGTYTKINYTKIYDNYKWRVPLDKANFNEGFKSNKNDDKGSFIYGEKEYWYINSIETKNYVAEFTLGSREDGLGVLGIDGGRDNNMKLRKLDKITLYSKPDRKGSNPIPIKTVNFVYSYKLCGEVPNNSEVDLADGSNVNRGKLTLEKVYFTYGNSNKAKLSSYKFFYTGENPKYNLKGYDRWGNYKQNKQVTACNEIANADFPYVNQDKIDADKNSSAWSLTQIKLPSGGTININYESDDYAYVQDKRAMQMFNVTGIGDTDNPDDNQLSGQNNNVLYDGSDNKNYLYFRLQDPIPDNTQNPLNILKTEYIKDLLQDEKYLYFKFFIALNKDSDYEYVPGYAKIDDLPGNIGYGLIKRGTEFTHGWIRIKDKSINDRSDNSTRVNAIARTAWQFTRLNLPKIAYGETNVKDDAFTQVAYSLANMVGSIGDLFRGFNRTMRAREQGRIVDLAKSVIRLYNPNKKKLGGGSRVKLLEIKDEWDLMTNSNSPGYSYGISYDYTDKEYMADGSTRTVSTGVASYEPQIGGDENPFREPVFFDEEYLMAPDNEHYLEKPFGESFFPSPSVVYSKVTIKSIAPGSTANTWKSANTGHTVHEFYTAKDFPTFTSNTGLGAIIKKNNPILRFLHIDVKEYLTASQGYVIELNDMHGKPKAQTVYAENNPSPISMVKYEYSTEPNQPNKLNNKVTVIDEGGNKKEATIGVDFDMIADSREGSTMTKNYGILGNVDVILAFIVPIPIPIILPSYSQEHTRFRSIVTTKVINKYGILKKTIAMQDGAKVETENVAFDEETGEVLLTKVKNEYNDDLYNLNYPAHWAYDRMGPAYKNIDFQIEKCHIGSSGQIQISTPGKASDYFVLGDELLVNYFDGTSNKVWVNEIGHNYVRVINSEGKNPEQGNCKIRIIRSGRRNQQTASIGSVTLKNNPLLGNSLDISLGKGILNANAVEYSENWQAVCGDIQASTTSTALVLTDQGLALKDLLNQLINNNKLTRSSIYLGNKEQSAIGFDKYTEVLRNAVPSNKSHYWYSTLSTNKLDAYISDNCGGQTRCNITLQGNNMPNIKSISTFVPEYSTACSTGNCPNITYYFSLTDIEGKTYKGAASCFIIGEWQKNYASSSCDVKPNIYVNPYLKGILGSWRPKRSLVYLTDRTGSNTTNTQIDGVFANNFSAFWTPSLSSDKKWTKNNDKRWTFTSEVTKYDPFGNELENKDALGRFSSELTGYNHSLVTAVASNAKYQQIAFDNIEDYSFADKLSSCNTSGHWDFSKGLGINAFVDNVERHSGKRSIKVLALEQHSVIRTISDCILQNDANCVDKRKVQPGDCSGRFNPCPGKYIVSAWVKENDPLNPGTYEAPHVLIEIKDANQNNIGTPIEAHAKGSIIDGWQRVFEEFIIPANAASIKVTMKSGTKITYFDDLRIHPFNANMKSYVYDPVTLRLSAVLDENNYATFYEYDEEGALTRIKKETKDGVYTIQETRSAKFKQY